MAPTLGDALDAQSENEVFGTTRRCPLAPCSKGAPSSGLMLGADGEGEHVVHFENRFFEEQRGGAANDGGHACHEVAECDAQITALVAKEGIHPADSSGENDALHTGEQAEVEDEESGVLTGHCQCNGNCGSRVHKKLANKLYRVARADGSGDVAVAICKATPGPGSRFCRRCECERDGCKSSRTAKGRWCRKHYCSQPTPGTYTVPSGEHSYHKSWPLHVKVLARLGHLLPFVEPADCTALLQLASEHEVYKAGELVGIAGAYMFVAHLMKGPPVVYEFSRRLRLQLADHPGVGCTAAELVSLYQAMIEFSSGSRWSEMFDRMNGTTSLMDAQTGLAVFASRLALLTKREEEGEGVKPLEKKMKRTRLNLKTGLKAKKKAPRRSRSQSVASINAREAEADTKTRVSLGRAQTMYEMESDTGPATEVFNVIVDAFSTSTLRWPSSSDGLEEFGDG